ncbi:MAG: transporter, partial [Flavobacteriaceae bacterium]|nr:transporter [Flavobacteriaceae bacterium]
NSYSFGIGLDLGSTILNLSHKTIESEKNYQLFDTGLTDSALINTTNSISSLSVIFKF